MSTYDIRNDAPGMLRLEAVNITLKFDRTGPTTGRISWNIPSPAPGCTSDSQAYSGMVVTIDTSPTNSTKLPTKGQVYNSDVTADANLFAGDSLGTSLVVGAFYDDRVTTFFDVTGLKPNTPYYVTGFPVDSQYRYFIEGVHAYSLDYTNRGSDGTSGTQVVVLNADGQTMGLDPETYTGLFAGTAYDFSIQLGPDPKPLRPVSVTEFHPAAPKYAITIDGENAQTYTQLVVAINKAFALLKTTTQGPTAPNTGSYYYSSAQKKLFQWSGSEYIELSVLVRATAPNTLVVGTYWYNDATKVLNLWNGSAWGTATVLHVNHDPMVPVPDQSVWYNGTTAYEWNGATWCELTTFAQATDPSLAVTPAPDAFWYNTTQKLTYKWNTAAEMWTTVTAVQATVDPNTPATGSFWFNDLTNQLYKYAAGWALQTNVAISEYEPTFPASGKLWYNPTTQTLVQRDSTNTTWASQVVITLGQDPTARASCDLWWNTTTQRMSVWDKLNNVWVQSSQFFQQSTDPSSPPALSNGTAWVNTATGVLTTFSNGCFSTADVTYYATDPRSGIANGIVWHDITSDQWYARVSGAWSQINPVITQADPSAFATGTFWFNTTNSGLNSWNGISWVSTTYSSSSLVPAKGTMWFDTSVNVLKLWDGAMWSLATPYATVEIDSNRNLLFTDTTIGSMSMIRITDGTLFQSLETSAMVDTPRQGNDGVSSTPMYNELGIGTDGNDAAREKLQTELRFELGYPNVDAELTKDQLDYAIDKAISEFRARSSLGYKRGFFFLTVNPNEQRVILSSKVNNHNRIVDVMGVFRLTSAFLASAHGAGVYGQIVLQHMYNMGSFDMLSFHIMSEYTKLLEILFAGRVTYTWNEQKRELYMHNRFSQREQIVAIEATEERTEQDLMVDRYTKPWIRRYAAAVCRLMLAESRGKFGSLPGAGGNITLNAAELRQAGKEEIEACILEIENYVADRPEEYGIGTQFLFG